jgi:hypothetical protein
MRNYWGVVSDAVILAGLVGVAIMVVSWTARADSLGAYGSGERPAYERPDLARRDDVLNMRIPKLELDDVNITGERRVLIYAIHP